MPLPRLTPGPFWILRTCTTKASNQTVIQSCPIQNRMLPNRTKKNLIFFSAKTRPNRRNQNRLLRRLQRNCQPHRQKCRKTSQRNHSLLSQRTRSLQTKNRISKIRRTGCSQILMNQQAKLKRLNLQHFQIRITQLFLRHRNRDPCRNLGSCRLAN